MKTKFETLSPEAKEVALNMIHYCIENGIGMGMDEGWHERTDKYGSPTRSRKRKFRKELEGLCAFRS